MAVIAVVACGPNSAFAHGHDLVSRSSYAADDGWQGADGLRAVTASVVHDHDGAGMEG